MSGRLAAARRRDGADPALRRGARGALSPEALAALDPVVVVDALGTFCPEPVIRTQNRVGELAAGEVLLLLADDAGVEVDIPAWCMSTGNEFLGLLRGEAAYRVFVRRGAPRERPSARAAALTRSDR